MLCLCLFLCPRLCLYPRLCLWNTWGDPFSSGNLIWKRPNPKYRVPYEERYLCAIREGGVSLLLLLLLLSLFCRFLGLCLFLFVSVYLLWGFIECECVVFVIISLPFYLSYVRLLCLLFFVFTYLILFTCLLCLFVALVFVVFVMSDCLSV